MTVSDALDLVVFTEGRAEVLAGAENLTRRVRFYLEALAKDGVSEFAFVCLPLKIAGATGSWVRPLAVV